MILVIRVEEAGLGVKSSADNRREVVHQSGGEDLILVALVNDCPLFFRCAHVLQYSTAVPSFRL